MWTSPLYAEVLLYLSGAFTRSAGRPGILPAVAARKARQVDRLSMGGSIMMRCTSDYSQLKVLSENYTNHDTYVFLLSRFSTGREKRCIKKKKKKKS